MIWTAATGLATSTVVEPSRRLAQRPDLAVLVSAYGPLRGLARWVTRRGLPPQGPFAQHADGPRGGTPPDLRGSAARAR